MPKLRRAYAWWVSDATEICPACGQAYAYHTEFRCIDCDGPLCPICVELRRVTATTEFACSTCFEPKETEVTE